MREWSQEVAPWGKWATTLAQGSSPWVGGYGIELVYGHSFPAEPTWEGRETWKTIAKPAGEGSG